MGQVPESKLLRNNLQASVSELENQSFNNSNSRLTRTSMIGELREHQADAWIAFHQIYGGFVHHWIRRAGLDASESADVSQEVFSAVSQSIDSYEHSREKKGSFRAWLFGITRNKINDHLRKKLRQPIPEGGEDGQAKLLLVAEKEEQELSKCQDSFFSTKIHQVVQSVKQDFGQQTWQVFWRVVVHGESPTNVASDLKISPEAARQAKFRVLKRMRDELDNVYYLSE